MFHRTLPDVLVCPISSQPRYFRKPGPGDHPLTNWRSTGLYRASTARVSKILSIDKQIISHVLRENSRTEVVLEPVSPPLVVAAAEAKPAQTVMLPLPRALRHHLEPLLTPSLA